MPPPPFKMLKPTVATEKEQQIEQLLMDTGYFETLEVYRAEKNKRYRLPTEHQENTNFIEKRGDVWRCSFCEKTFTTKGSAKRHLVSTHSADSKQFECPKCTSKFARRDDLYTHLRRMHAANDLVEMMIEEHRAELKGEHKGLGRGKLFSVVSHNEHLDLVLPSGNTICRPFATDASSTDAKEPVKAAKACRTSKCNHWRVIHDDHEDVLVNGSLHHKNEEGEWECHGEIGSLEDFEFLVSNSQSLEQAEPIPVSGQPCLSHEHGSHEHGSHEHGSHDLLSGNHHLLNEAHELSFEDDLDFFLGAHVEPVVPAKQSVETLLLPGGSVLCRKIGSNTARFHTWQHLSHKHSLNCGHNRMRHGNHYDYVVGNIVESEHAGCPMNGTVVLEQNDSETLSFVVTALATDQQPQASPLEEGAAAEAI